MELDRRSEAVDWNKRNLYTLVCIKVGMNSLIVLQ